MKCTLPVLCAALLLLPAAAGAAAAAPKSAKPAPHHRAAKGRTAGRRPRKGAATRPLPASAVATPPSAQGPWRPEPDRPWELLEKVTVEITRVDGEHSTLAGKDRIGREQVFRFGPGTLVRRLDPTAPAYTLAEIGSPGLPLALHQQVMVTWKEDRVTRQRIAVQLTTP